jgi:hypothetical protein
MSCPYTSLQNGKAERTLRTTNNMIRSLVFYAFFPVRYWIDGLHTATYLLNRLFSMTIHESCPYVTLHGVAPSYEHLRVFHCTCYPNLSDQAPHKLVPRSIRCAFLGYSADHKGYQCLGLSTNNIIISRHVVFDETDFPFAVSPRLTNDLDIFLQDNSWSAAPMPAPLTAPPRFLVSPRRWWSLPPRAVRLCARRHRAPKLLVVRPLPGRSARAFAAIRPHRH